MTQPHTELQLWPAHAGREAGTAGAPGAGALPLPDALTLVPAPGDGSPIRFEPLTTRQRQVRLLATFPGALAPRVNGAPAAHRAILAPGDLVAWAPDFNYRVVLINRPRVGPPPAALVGRPCPVCRVELTAATTCVQCACGTALHCESDPEHGLQCAQLTRACPVCQRPVVLTETIFPAPSDEI